MGNRMANQDCSNAPVSDVCLKSRTLVCRAHNMWQCLMGVSTTDFKTLSFGGFKEFSFNFTSNLHQMPGIVLELFGGQRNLLTFVFLTRDKLTQINNCKFVQTVLGSQLQSTYTLGLHAHNISHVMVLFLFEINRNKTNQVCVKNEELRNMHNWKIIPHNFHSERLHPFSHSRDVLW